jgi:hypothetical protein
MHEDDVARNDGHLRAVFLNLIPGVPYPPVAPYETLPMYMDTILNNGDPVKRMDGSSMTLYPFVPNGTNIPSYYIRLKYHRNAAGTRPWWGLSAIDENIDGATGYVFSESQIRFQAFGPVAMGAKGLMWFVYTPGDDNPVHFDGAANLGIIPTCKYYIVRTINRYLRAVAGPVVMNDTSLGLFHQATSETWTAEDFVTSLAARRSLGTTISPSALPASGRAAGLRSVHHQQVRPPFQRRFSCGFVHGDRSSVGHRLHRRIELCVRGDRNFLPVSLQGGEGRFYRLRSSATPDLRLTWPVGGGDMALLQTRNGDVDRHGLTGDDPPLREPAAGRHGSLRPKHDPRFERERQRRRSQCRP